MAVLTPQNMSMNGDSRGRFAAIRPYASSPAFFHKKYNQRSFLQPPILSPQQLQSSLSRDDHDMMSDTGSVLLLDAGTFQTPKISPSRVETPKPPVGSSLISPTVVLSTPSLVKPVTSPPTMRSPAISVTRIPSTKFYSQTETSRPPRPVQPVVLKRKASIQPGSHPKHPKLLKPKDILTPQLNRQGGKKRHEKFARPAKTRKVISESVVGVKPVAKKFVEENPEVGVVDDIDFVLTPTKENGVKRSKSAPQTMPRSKNNIGGSVRIGWEQLDTVTSDVHEACQECGTVYNPVDTVDHDMYHSRVVDGVEWIPRHMWRSSPGKQISPGQVGPVLPNGGRIVNVNDSSTSSVVKKAREVLEVVGSVLGSPDERNPSQQIFVHVSSENRVVGCVVAESLEKAKRIVKNDEDVVLGSENEHRCTLGISAMWVLAKERRNGVCTSLVDAARNHYYYGHIVPRHMLAFSQPTPSGRLFAKEYAGSNTFLVY